MKDKLILIVIGFLVVMSAYYLIGKVIRDVSVVSYATEQESLARIADSLDEIVKELHST